MTEVAPKYEDLSEYDKKCVYATNYWRRKNDLPLIDVPKGDKVYWALWDAMLKTETPSFSNISLNGICYGLDDKGNKIYGFRGKTYIVDGENVKQRIKDNQN